VFNESNNENLFPNKANHAPFSILIPTIVKNNIFFPELIQ
jgi:hypothetical protein